MRFVGWATMLLFVFARSLPAQGAELRCPGCTIEAELVATLVGPDEGFYEGQPPQISERTWGDRWVVWTFKQLLLYNRDGSLAGSIGNQGQGPMEWKNIADVVVKGDSLVVFDTGNARATVIGPDRDMVREFHVPGFVLRDVEYLGNGRYALAMHLRGDKASAGRAVLTFAETGEIFSRFDEFDLVPQLASQRAYRKLALTDGQIVTGGLDYTLRKFTVGGELLEVVVERPPQWTISMIGGKFDGTFGPDHTPPSFFVDLASDRDLLWTLVAIPREDWKDALVETGDVVGLNPFAAYKQLVELIDPDSLQVISRAEFDGYPVAVLEGGYFASSRADDLGLITLDLYRLTVKPSTGAGQ